MMLPPLRADHQRDQQRDERTSGRAEHAQHLESLRRARLDEAGLREGLREFLALAAYSRSGGGIRATPI